VKGLKRWLGVLVAVLFLSTATLHVLAHHGETDGDCSVCQVQASSLPAAAAPCVVVVQTLQSAPQPKPAATVVAARIAVLPARAPPALSA
jgi:hypothetical protein